MLAYIYFRGPAVPPETTNAVDMNNIVGARSPNIVGARSPNIAGARSPNAVTEEVLILTGSGLAQNALAAFTSGDYIHAAGLFRELSGSDKRALRGAGVSYYRAGDYANAKRFLEESLKTSDGFIERKLLASIYYRENDLQRSILSAEAGLSIKNDPELAALHAKLKDELKTQAGFAETGAIHFRAFFDGRERPETARNVLDMLEEAYTSIGEKLFYFPQEPIIVILYTEKDFFEATKVPDWSMGLYDGKIRIPVRGLGGAVPPVKGAGSTDIAGARGALRKTLFHEYTHALVHQLVKDPPVWLNEGLAEYFSGGGERVGQEISLRELEGSFLQMDRDKMTVAYKESYSAVAYLVERHGLQSITGLLQALGEGKTLNQAFREAFSMSYNEFIITWGRGARPPARGYEPPRQARPPVVKR